MSIPNRPGSRAENLYGNMIGQETATPPTNPQSRIEDYLDYILNNGTQLEQEIKDDVDALKGIGRYLSLWDCTTGKPTTDPKKLPYKYKSGDYYIVSTVGNTNYMPSGTQYEGVASSTTDSGVSVNDFYLFDGTTWSRMAHSSVESVFVANYTEAEGDYTCDKTFSEIIAAYNAGKMCLANFCSSNQYVVGYIHSVFDNEIRSEIIWLSAFIDGDENSSIRYQYYFHNGDDGISARYSYSSVLPSISPESDEGKVLGVSDEEWAIVDPPQNVFVANYTYANSAWSCDKTFAEIKAAYDAGKLCLANGGIAFGNFAYIISANSDRIIWNSVNMNMQSHGTISMNSFHHENDNTMSNHSYPAWVIPSVTSSDNGKVLGVSNGQWNKVDQVDVHNVPSGGTTGQVLKKASATDYDVTWANESGGGGGGDVLVVHYTPENGDIVCDTTYSDIRAAIADGSPVAGTFNDGDFSAYLYSVTMDPAGAIVFIGRVYYTADAIRIKVSHRSNEQITYEFCSDHPIEFSIKCDAGFGFLEQIGSCDLHEVAPPSTWITLQSLIDAYGPDVGRSLCAKATVYYADPVFRTNGSVEKEVRYYCDGILNRGSVYTFTFAADDGSSLVFDADISDPNNIVYGMSAASDCTILPAATMGAAIPSYAAASWTCSLYGVINPDNEGYDRISGSLVVCFPIYPVTQKFIAASLQNLGNDVTITYDTNDDPDFDFALYWIRNPCLIIPTVDENTYDGTQQSLYLTRKFYITNYMAEYLECKFPFNYNDTQFMGDIKNLKVTGFGNSAVITVTGNFTLA